MNGGSPDAPFAVLAAVALLALALLAGFRWLRARSPGGGEEAIRLLAVRSLGGKRLIALVEVEEERFLVGMTEERISCLGRMRPVAADTGFGRLGGAEERA